MAGNCQLYMAPPQSGVIYFTPKSVEWKTHPTELTGFGGQPPWKVLFNQPESP